MTPGESPNDELFAGLLAEEQAREEASKLKKSPKKKSDPPPLRISYYDDVESGILYLTAIESGRNYMFVCEELGRIVTRPDLLIDGKRYMPQKIPEINGMISDVVTVPRLDLLQQAPLLSADVLANEIKAHISRYFDAPPLEIDLFTYYIVFTWFYQKGNVAPLLRFLADLGSGKSRGLDVIGDLCFYRTRLDGGTTLSSIMRLKQQWQGTCVMDEADIKGDSRSEADGFENVLAKFLNLGFERGRPMLKTNTNDLSVQEVYDPFGPKILGMRSPFKDGAIESRCLSYSPVETSRDDIPIILPPAYITERDLLVAKIARFTLHHWPSVDGFDFIDVRGMPIDKRTAQSAAPLSFVIKQLFPGGEETFKNYIRLRYREIQRIRSQSDEGGAFNTLVSLAIGEINLSREFPSLYTQEGIPIRVTPRMLAAAYGWSSSNRITKKLVDILHFEKRKEKVSGRSETVVIVPNEDAWKSAYRRYHYTDDEQESFIPAIPPALDRGCRLKCKDNDGSKVPEVLKTGGEGVYPSVSTNTKKNTIRTQVIGTNGTIDRDTPSPPVSGTFGTLEPESENCKESSESSKISDDSDLARFLKFAGLSCLPNIPLYHRMTPDARRRFGRCIVAGCENPKMYADLRGEQYLCEPHYLMLKRRFFPDPEQAGGV